jgi:hypothetical protein
VCVALHCRRPPLKVAVVARLPAAATSLLRRGIVNPDPLYHEGGGPVTELPNFSRHFLPPGVLAIAASVEVPEWPGSPAPDPSTTSVARAAVVGWTPRTHWLHHGAARDAARTVLLVAARLDAGWALHQHKVYQAQLLRQLPPPLPSRTPLSSPPPMTSPPPMMMKMAPLPAPPLLSFPPLDFALPTSISSDCCSGGGGGGGGGGGDVGVADNVTATLTSAALGAATSRLRAGAESPLCLAGCGSSTTALASSATVATVVTSVSGGVDSWAADDNAGGDGDFPRLPPELWRDGVLRFINRQWWAVSQPQHVTLAPAPSPTPPPVPSAGLLEGLAHPETPPRLPLLLVQTNE